MEITINDEVYTLDGLVKAYKLQLDALEASVDDRMILALSNRLADDSVIKRLLCNELQYSQSMREAIATLLVYKTGFADMIVSRVQDRIMLLLEDKIQELVKRNLETWWDRRFSEIKSIVDAQIESGNATAQRRESTLKATLQLLLGDTIKDTVVDVVKEEVSGRVTELRAQPTFIVEPGQAAIFTDPMYPAAKTPETRSFHYEIGETKFESLEEAKRALGNAYEGTNLYYVDDSDRTLIYTASDTSEIIPVLDTSNFHPNDH